LSKAGQLSQGYRRASKDLRAKVKRLQANPTADNLHDLRTSIRRLEAVVDLFPKNIRKSKKMRKFLAPCRKLFRSTTPVRDIDVVLQSINSNTSEERIQPIVSKIKQDRDPLVSNVLHFAELLEEIDPPRITKSDLSSREIAKRRDKIIRRLVAKLEEEVPIVLGDFRKIKELHDVRKECKMLRYILELFPSDRYDDLVKLMRNWQTILGTIRDIDVTQQFAEEKGFVEDLEGVLTKLRFSRDKMLGSFSSSARQEMSVIPAEIV